MEFDPNFLNTADYGALADSPSTNEWKILKAAERGDVNFFMMLAEKITEFRRTCETTQTDHGVPVLHYATVNGRIALCKYLIEQVGVDINLKDGKGNRPLMLAVYFGYKELVEYLIGKGADVNAANKRNATALHFAAGLNKVSVIPLLLLNGANLEATTSGGTPLQLAALCGNPEATQMTLALGANPNSIPLFTFSAVVLAIMKPSLVCLELLLKGGADPNADVYGKSPLAYAAERGEIELMKTLLEANANPNARSSCVVHPGLKPIENAAKAGKHEAVELLLPVTEQISSILDWTVGGIIGYHTPDPEHAT